MPQPTGCRPPRAVDGHPGQAILAIEKWYRLHSRVPVAHEILAHGQTQAADQQHAQPPVVEHQERGTGAGAPRYQYTTSDSTRAEMVTALAMAINASLPR